MSSVMELIRPELSELSALELETLPYLTLLTLISYKLGQNVCDLKISDEFDYGYNRTRTVRVTCP